MTFFGKVKSAKNIVNNSKSHYSEQPNMGLKLDFFKKSLKLTSGSPLGKDSTSSTISTRHTARLHDVRQQRAMGFEKATWCRTAAGHGLRKGPCLRRGMPFSGQRGAPGASPGPVLSIRAACCPTSCTALAAQKFLCVA